MTCHVRDSVRQIDPQSWLIGGEFVVSRRRSAQGSLWGDSHGWGYTILDPPPFPPSTSPLPPESHVRLIHDAGDASAVWTFGHAFLKVKLVQDTNTATEEHVTLKWLAERKLSFAVPSVLYHAQDDDKRYLIVSRLPGTTLNEAWRSMSDNEKEYYVNRIADICVELSGWESDAMTGVDGKELPDNWLDPCRTPHDFRAETLKGNCLQLGMECSTFVFGHNDLGPSNIIVDREDLSVGIIDWEMAGFVPRGWIRTKFDVSWGMDFGWRDVGDDLLLAEWRKRVAERLGATGFPEVNNSWKEWFNMRYKMRASHRIEIN
ncbi:kinase-like domain-containing protein [Coniochaeta sp. 2T2.1]|nr:kinase-like domain-containing protein [Coniochaeta sp. 2T2.1]